MSIRLPVITSACLLALFFAAPARAQFAAAARQASEPYHVELGASWWTPAPTIVLRSGSPDDVDVINLFGIEDTRFRMLSAVLKPARKHKIRFQYVPMKYDQDAIINQTIAFGGRTFVVNAAANAMIDWKLIRLGYEWDPVASANGFFGVIAELKYNRVKTLLSSETLDAATATDTTAPFPAIGVIGRYYLVPRALSVTAEFTGSKIPTRDNVEGRFLDFDIYGTIHLGPHAGVQAGYRSIDAKYVIDDDAGTLKMKGAYLGATVRF